ncbi:MAG: DUF4231 domain-containing protein [Planctomycetes bacterium]|nr:DUF4231 domain-containing protein [Planctomycetota bacterium]
MSNGNSVSKQDMPKDDNGIYKYIKERLQDQQSWYGGKANLNKKRFMRFQTVIIILGALIPLIVVFDNYATGLVNNDPNKVPAFFTGLPGIISAVISATIAILAGIDKLAQPQANWFNYRANEEMLKKEEWMYRYMAGPYKGLKKEEAKKLLVERVESVIAADIARFAQAEYKKEEDVNTIPKKEPNEE